ncbi:MAG TPA: sigma-70 family RNA polymerase sigma factor [Kofleriaceae bacterium]|nr:sigma-70 family RNA polymerase sigma factor [Kofleriaceae bacterium]
MTAPKPPGPDDAADDEPAAAQLAARARDGDRGAFDELVVRHRPRLVAFLARRLADTADAEDVAQETFLRAFDHLASYDPGRPFATWLFAIGKNVAANHAVARARREARDRGSAAVAAEAAAGTAVGAAVDTAGGGGVWQRAAAVLSRDAYRALWLRYAQGLSVREIAGELRRSSVAIKVMLFRARRRLLQEVR